MAAVHVCLELSRHRRVFQQKTRSVARDARVDEARALRPHRFKRRGSLVHLLEQGRVHFLQRANLRLGAERGRARQRLRLHQARRRGMDLGLERFDHLAELVAVSPRGADDRLCRLERCDCGGALGRARRRRSLGAPPHSAARAQLLGKRRARSRQRDLARRLAGLRAVVCVDELLLQRGRVRAACLGETASLGGILAEAAQLRACVRRQRTLVARGVVALRAGGLGQSRVAFDHHGRVRGVRRVGGRLAVRRERVRFGDLCL
mmetsp:Transcript_17354/g.58628  ORF Transcript_17354/g.58628 Transcript_17354/m.58628 type:complete len:263 (-) Transcript_17354:84-872(-)